MTEALERVQTRRLNMPMQETEDDIQEKDAKGKLFVFQSAKGGSGVTTLAINFAVSLASSVIVKAPCSSISIFRWEMPRSTWAQEPLLHRKCA